MRFKIGKQLLAFVPHHFFLSVFIGKYVKKSIAYIMLIVPRKFYFMNLGVPLCATVMTPIAN